MQEGAYTFLLTLQKLQLGIMADEVLDLKFGSLTYSQGDDSVYFNNVLVNNVLTDDEVDEAEKRLQSKRRTPTFYFENTLRLGSLKTQLTTKTYKQSFEDCWMFHPGTSINTARFSEVKNVTSESDLEVFIKTLDQSFQKGDPQNPYGELGEYLKIVRNSWHSVKETNRLQYFIAYKDDQAVAVSTLTSYQGHGYISNVGSLKSVRGQGYGKLATLYAVNQSVSNGNNLHYLGTEEGHYPNVFYTKIGFETRYKAVGWTKTTHPLIST